MIPADLPAEELARLAAERPDLWPEIQWHPNVYPELQQWISQAQQNATFPQSAQGPQGAPFTGQGAQFTEYGAQGAQFAQQDGMPAQASRGRATAGKQGIAILAAVLSVLLLAGAGFGLSMTQTWPFNADGPLAGVSGARTAAAEKDALSYADGIEEKWTLSGEDIAPDMSLSGYLPRMMPPVVRMARTADPIQLDGGVAFPFYDSSDDGFPSAGWAMVNPESGEVEWSESPEYSNHSCAVNDARSDAVCAQSTVGPGRLVHMTTAGFTEVSELEQLGEPQTTIWFDDGDVALMNADGYRETDVLGRFDDDAAITANESTQMLTMSNAEQASGCGWVIAAGTKSYLGSECDAPASEVLITSDAFNWAIIDDDEPKIVVDTKSEISVFDARTREEVWSGEGVIPGWYRAPQIVEHKGGDRLLISRGLGASARTHWLVNLQTGEEVQLGEPSRVSTATVAGGEVLVFSGEDPFGDPINHVKVFDPANGVLLAEHDIPPIENVAEVVGGPDGVLIGHRSCTDCTTAEGSEMIDHYTFLGPVDSGSGATEAAVIPANMPFDCPADTILLAWAEIENGWLLICGVSANEPTHMRVQLPDGSLDGTTTEVSWDPALNRFVGSFAGDVRYTVDDSTGTVTVRDIQAGTTLAQEPFVRWLFVPLGSKERTAADIEGESGTYEVPLPEDTAEDQVRYMIEVLEKAYEGRALVKDALPKLQNCTADAGEYGNTVTKMEAVRDNRAELLDALASMPVDKIPQGQQLLDDLTESISLSHQANVEYVDWAERADLYGCAALSAAGESAASASDAPKKRFAKRWNRVITPEFDVRTFNGWYI